MYMIVWLCMTTREVIVSESTEHPNSAWVVKQTEEFLDQTRNREDKPSIVIHDRDAKFTKEFVAMLEKQGVQDNALPKSSPNLNGRCERSIGIILWECLDKFLFFRKRHLDYLCTEFTEHYNRHRSHMERDHLPPIREEPEEIESLSPNQIEVKSFVGGLVKSFERKVA